MCPTTANLSVDHLQSSAPLRSWHAQRNLNGGSTISRKSTAYYDAEQKQDASTESHFGTPQLCVTSAARVDQWKEEA